eukprot:SAG31_NODE_3687_length_3987_cov_4.811214_2_plen_51_part_00
MVPDDAVPAIQDDIILILNLIFTTKFSSLDNRYFKNIKLGFNVPRSSIKI